MALIQWAELEAWLQFPWDRPSYPDGWDHAVPLAKVSLVLEIWESFQWVARARRERLADKNCGIVERIDL